MVGGKIDLTVKIMRDIYNNAANFAQEIKDKTTVLRVGRVSVITRWFVQVHS